MNYLSYTLLLLFACGSNPLITKETINTHKTIKTEKNTNTFFFEKYPKKDTSFVIKGHQVDIRVPKNTNQKNPKGAILVLPGWSFNRKDWCEKSSLCKKFLTENYILVLPEMNKSVYSSKFYTETYAEGRLSPNKQWILEDFMPFLQEKFGIFQKGNKNFVLGLSTGGRGVALLCLALPEIWTAGAGLSGDYEQTLMPNDNLIKAFYGDFKTFGERWKNEDNPNQQAKNFKTPLYLGHGKLDKVVPVQQTEVFYESLKKHNPTLRLQLNLPPNAQHDYKYWDSEVENMIKFFGNF
jgi:S-formylglutathione hydrolase FrmB